MCLEIRLFTDPVWNELKGCEGEAVSEGRFPYKKYFTNHSAMH